MKLTKEQLKQIIKEELEAALEESEYERDIKPIGITSDSRAFSALQWWREVADRPTQPYRFKEDGPPDTLIRLHPNSNMFKKELFISGIELRSSNNMGERSFL